MVLVGSKIMQAKNYPQFNYVGKEFKVTSIDEGNGLIGFESEWETIPGVCIKGFMDYDEYQRFFVPVEDKEEDEK